MKLLKLDGISKRYALAAARYRRCAKKQMAGLDYSEQALRQLHDWESKGVGRVEKNNGYAYGKFVVDLSVSMWIEDIRAGNACKAEFLSTAIERIHNAKKLRDVQAGAVAWPFPPFPNPLDKPGQPAAPAKFNPSKDDYEPAPY